MNGIETVTATLSRIVTSRSTSIEPITSSIVSWLEEDLVASNRNRTPIE
jgi:hypothetical protein